MTYYASSDLVINTTATSKLCAYRLDKDSVDCPYSDGSDAFGGDDNNCYDFDRTPLEYRTAFVTNVISIALPISTFFVMCSRELLPFFDGLIKNLEVR
jgi:hypothetical protein